MTEQVKSIFKVIEHGALSGIAVAIIFLALEIKESNVKTAKILDRMEQQHKEVSFFKSEVSKKLTGVSISISKASGILVTEMEEKNVPISDSFWIELRNSRSKIDLTKSWLIEN